ncbi:MAG: nucleotide exchange factor GrpE, partial [Actinomycetota bacterium]
PDEVLDATPAEPQNDDVVNVTEAAGAADPVDGVGDVPGDAVPDSSAPDDDEVVDAELVDDDHSGGNPADAGPGAGDDASDPASTGDAEADMTVEDLVLDLERVTSERDQYLDASRRLQAEFENYKKQVGKREATARERANDSLIEELLPVMDAFDGAIANGAEDVAPMRTSFLNALAKQGLERIDPTDAPFDPNLHEAVMHEDAADVDGPVVAEVMRAGYAWKGRVLRPAMVKTRG